MNDDLIKKLKDNPQFSELQEWIILKIKQLDSIDGLDGLSNEQAGEEVRVRAKAVVKLQEILSPFIEFRERRDPTPSEIQKKKSQFGL